MPTVTVRMGERGRLVRHATDNTVDRRSDDAVMRVALELTRETYPHPNPRVGAVVVWPHHVAHITGRTKDGQWIVKSGNDGGRVRERPRSVRGAVFRKI